LVVLQVEREHEIILRSATKKLKHVDVDELVGQSVDHQQPAMNLGRRAAQLFQKLCRQTEAFSPDNIITVQWF